MSESTETVKEVTVHPHLIILQYRMLMRQREVKIKNVLYVHYDCNYIKHV